VRFSSESTPLDISESKASAAETLLQESILFLQIFDRIELPAIDPARKQSEGIASAGCSEAFSQV
jgi:hypothetical protein